MPNRWAHAARSIEASSPGSIGPESPGSSMTANAESIGSGAGRSSGPGAGENQGSSLDLCSAGQVQIGSELLDRAGEYISSARSASTRRAYSGAWGRFRRWAASVGAGVDPPSDQTVALYLAHLAEQGKLPSTIESALCAISQACLARGFGSPRLSQIVRTMRRGIRRRMGAKARNKKDAVTVAELAAMVASCPESGARGLRDRAILVLDFAGGFRRSELVALDACDVSLSDSGARIEIRRSKTDQDGQGLVKAVAYGSSRATCPVRCLRAWTQHAGISDGPLFRAIAAGQRVTPRRLCDRQIARIVKRAARAAGLDPRRLSGHSMRSGLATAAIRAGKPLTSVMAHLGHTDPKTLAGYVREANLFVNNPSEGIGL